MKKITSSRLLWPAVVLIGLLLANLLWNHSFFDITMRDGNLYGAPIDILRRAAPVVLVALGMTLVIATRGIDLSVGAVAAISGSWASMYIISSADGASVSVVLTAVAVALLMALIAGAWNGFLVSVLGIQPIVATLVLMVAGRGLAQIITDEKILYPDNSPAYKLIGGGYLLAVPFSILLAGGIFALTAALTRKTALGTLIESVGVNPEASRLAGVRARPIIFLAYVFSGLCAGIAGLMLTSNSTSADPNSIGLFIELDAILAVVIGGTSLAGGRFSLAGTLIGAFIIETMDAFVVIAISSRSTDVFKACVVIVVCLLQSHRVRAWLLNVLRWGRPPSRPENQPRPPAAADLREPSSAPAPRARHRRRCRRAGHRVREGHPMTTSFAPKTPAAQARQRLSQRFEQYTQIGVTALLLVIMLFVGSLLYPNFTSGQAIFDLLGKNVFLIPLAVGMTFVILSGGIDLSVGAVMALGSVIAATLLQAGWPAYAVIPVVLLVACLLGLLVGVMISRFEIQPFIATLAAMFLARGLCLVITDRSIAIDNSFFQSMNLAHINLWEQETVNLRGRVRITDVYTTPSVLISLAVLAVAFVVLHYSRFGRTVYAVGGNEASARLMGLRVDRTKVSVYVISALCAGIAGLLFAFYTASGDPVAGIGYELNAIAAVVIGGTLLSGGSGYVLGSMLGVLVLATIYAYKEFDGDLNTGWTRVMIGVLVLFFIVLQRLVATRRRR